ncbi:hypothetical protein ANANG_G00171150 [Anguilla anguilla]|uniref:Uncharacterized protein n=1 Tax=Anguilla anguilla TaxID=7936 RepID=A0A9D3M3G2_ANGAN|nr:hypothetical protein ANANG_G00171150 [Anguilla anguilla]
MTTHQNHCKFVEPKQFINCLVCTDDLTRLETSFIHCDWQRNATKHAELGKMGARSMARTKQRSCNSDKYPERSSS